MTLSKLAFWKKSEKKAKVNGGGGVKQFLSRISGAFMLPISVMAIAGLFLGVGATIASHAGDNEALEKFGNFIKNLGDPIFGAMPTLFAAAIVVSFSDEAGIGVFAAVVAMLTFAAIQSVFIDSVDNVTGTAPTTVTTHVGYKVLFTEGGRNAEDMEHLVGSTLGIQSLNSSIFGGIAVGAIVAYLYNRFHTIQLPQMISFFGGKRFVSLAAIVAMIPLAFAFLLFWPWVGRGLAEFGKATGKVPYGFESFIFGYVERALIPFGLHHVFYASLWWTNAGGDAAHQIGTAAATNGAAGTGWLADHSFVGQAADLKTGIVNLVNTEKSKWVGDTYIWQSVNGLKYDTIQWVDKAGLVSGNGLDSTTLLPTDKSVVVHSMKAFPFFADQLEIKLGRYMQGKFSFMIFGLPAAGAAMVMAAPKENRKVALGTVFPAALTSFVTGVTEPIEFTFIFLAPLLFWGFHAFMAACSFLVMNVLGAHVGMTFSGGFMDLMIYGAIPVMKGTAFWWAFAIGAVLIPIYYFVFLWWIKKFNLDTPGRGGNTKLFTKKDFQASKAGGSTDKHALTGQSAAIVAAAGGWDNITKFSNCATRLRYDVKDNTIVDDAALKAAGAMGISRIGANHVQIIMGPQAEQINGNIKAHIGAPLGAAAAPAPKAEVKAEAPKAAVKAKPVAVKSVASGEVRTLASLKDGVFSEKMMGDGIVVCAPKTAKKADFFAPVSGELVTVFPTGHAYGIRTEEGLEVLVHIGIDTVNLNGQGFTPAVKQGDTVKAGEKLATVDLDYVRKNAPTADAIVIVTSGQTLAKKATGKVTKTSTLFEVK